MSHYQVLLSVTPSILLEVPAEVDVTGRVAFIALRLVVRLDLHEVQGESIPSAACPSLWPLAWNDVTTMLVSSMYKIRDLGLTGLLSASELSAVDRLAVDGPFKQLQRRLIDDTCCT